MNAQLLSDTILIKNHLEKIVLTEKPRNYQNIEVLNQVADYIFNEFSKYSEDVSFQTYIVNGKEYKNVICSFGLKDEERVIIGAHYDVCENQPGADDNASGVVGLLELARMFKGQKLNKRIDLVAYTLEEPPFYGTKHMGSFQHAQYLYENKIPVLGMVSLEMIGYFSDEKNSQGFPLKFLKLFYGNKGDFITTVRKFGSGKFARKFKNKMQKNQYIKHKSFLAPKKVTGTDFSDHRNYWHFGFSACMLTDTAFMRNKNYHQKTDTIETLNLTKMSNVINAVFDSVCLVLK